MKARWIIILLFPKLVIAGPVVTFFFRDSPITPERAEEISRKLRKPHGIAKRTLEGLTDHHPVSGIFSTYFGFLQVSSINGQVTFPRKQGSGDLQVIVTNKITPILMFENTISHWELEPGTPAVLYNVD